MIRPPTVVAVAMAALISQSAVAVDVSNPPPPAPSIWSQPREPRTPSPKPKVTPQPAKPFSDPAKWITQGDYLRRALRESRAGAVQVRLDINTNGRVVSCLIVKSSGHSDIDNYTCALFTRRARFVPATNDIGEPVNDTQSFSYEWVLPKELPTDGAGSAG